MSIPNIPDINPEICLCLEDVINLLFASIALEEIAISNILNAESEKILFLLENKENCYSIKELTNFNLSVEKVLNEVTSIESLLVSKLKCVTQIYNDINVCECDCDCCIDKCCNDNLSCECGCSNCKQNDNFDQILENCNCDNINEFKCNNLNNKFNKNLHYKNYNKISEVLNKIVGRLDNQ